MKEYRLVLDEGKPQFRKLQPGEAGLCLANKNFVFHGFNLDRESLGHYIVIEEVDAGGRLEHLESVVSGLLLRVNEQDELRGALRLELLTQLKRHAELLGEMKTRESQLSGKIEQIDQATADRLRQHHEQMKARDHRLEKLELTVSGLCNTAQNHYDHIAEHAKRLAELSTISNDQTGKFAEHSDWLVGLEQRLKAQVKHVEGLHCKVDAMSIAEVNASRYAQNTLGRVDSLHEGMKAQEAAVEELSKKVNDLAALEQPTTATAPVPPAAGFPDWVSDKYAGFQRVQNEIYAHRSPPDTWEPCFGVYLPHWNNNQPEFVCRSLNRFKKRFGCDWPSDSDGNLIVWWPNPNYKDKSDAPTGS